MKPIDFEGTNVIFGQDQEEYVPLPALRLPDSQVITCWEVTPEEAAEIARTGKLWLSQLTFNLPLQPQLPFAKQPFRIEPAPQEEPPPFQLRLVKGGQA